MQFNSCVFFQKKNLHKINFLSVVTVISILYKWACFEQMNCFTRKVTWTHKHYMCFYIRMHAYLYVCVCVCVKCVCIHKNTGLIFSGITLLLFPYIKGFFHHRKSTLKFKEGVCFQQCLVQIWGKTPVVRAEECYTQTNGCDCWESQHIGSSAVIMCFPKESFKRKEKLVWLIPVL